MVRISFVLLPDNKPLDGEAIARAHLRLMPEATRLVWEETEDEGTRVGMRLQDDSGDIILAVMPAPIDADEVQSAARLSLTAIKGEVAQLPHAVHVIVTFLDRGGRKPVQQATVLAQVTAAVADATGAVGVLWGAAHVAHPAEFFTVLVSGTDLPAHVLTGVSIAREGADLSFLSVGMKQFELPDMMFVASRSEGRVAIEFLHDMLTYTIDRGAPIPDGDTVGRTAEERLEVRYVPSPMGDSTEVARIDLRRPGLWARTRKLFLS